MAVTLATVDAAITAIQDGGQAFMVDGIQYSAGNIGALITLRKQLQREGERSGGGRPAFRGFNFGGMGYGSSSTSVTPTPVIVTGS